MIQQHTATVLNSQSTAQRHYFIRYCTSLSIPWTASRAILNTSQVFHELGSMLLSLMHCR